MFVVKVRRVGNSNVISLPKELEAEGFAPGVSVVIERMPGGQLRLGHASRLSDEEKDTIVRRVVRENREALELLTAYDRGEQASTELAERIRSTLAPRDG